MTDWLTDNERLTWVTFAAVLELLPKELDGQLTRDENLSHFDYFCLAMLSEAPERTLRMTTLASMTNATLPRLSRVVSRLEAGGFIERRTCDDDGRATNAILTGAGFAKVSHAAPGHVENVRRYVFDTLAPEHVDQLLDISRRLLSRLDPEGKMMATAREPTSPPVRSS